MSEQKRLWTRFFLWSDGRYSSDYSDEVPKTITNDTGHHFDLWSLDPLSHVVLYRWI